MHWNLVPKNLHNSIVATRRVELRRHLRLLVEVPAELTERKSGKKVIGVATNIGAGGCYIQASDTFPPGARVDLVLRFDGGIFCTRAVVTYSSTCTGIGMGVAFAGTNVFDWLADLSVIAASTSAVPNPNLKAIITH